MQFLNLVSIHIFVDNAPINTLENTMEASFLISVGIKYWNSFEESSISP